MLFLNLDEDMTARASILDAKSNINLTQEFSDRVFLSYQYIIFNIDNALVHNIISMMFMDTDSYIYMKQRKSKQGDQAVYFNVHKHFVGP